MNSFNYDFVKRHVDVLLFGLCFVFFLAFPKLDLWLSAQFYDSGFPWRQHFLINVIYHVFAKIHILFLFGLIGFSVFYWYKNQQVYKFASLYLLCSLLLGPGLLVNIILKDNSIGRPRPVHISEFGGHMEYKPAFIYSGECKKNCSFVSGHASIGFFAMAAFWVTRQRQWLLAGIALGALIGFARIAQGGHFLSDVVFSGWAIYFTCSLLSKAFHPKLTKLK